MQASVERIMPSLILNAGILLFSEVQRYKPCPEVYLSTKQNFFNAEENNVFGFYLRISLTQEDFKITGK